MNNQNPNARDFYTGRGPTATYLGTQLNPDNPAPIPAINLSSWGSREYTEHDYRQYVGRLVDNTGHTINPDASAEQDIVTPTWPHAHADSTDTPWTYCYDKGTVYVYRYGVEMLQVRCNTHRWDGPAKSPDRRRDWRPVNEFPTMRREAE
jgi:hypothetical protein